MFRHTVCEIDLSAIRHNVGVMRDCLAENVDFLAVVKADGYGHGAVQVARAAIDAGAKMLAVAIPEEGVQLRQAGIETPILVKSATTPTICIRSILMASSFTLYMPRNPPRKLP